MEYEYGNIKLKREQKISTDVHVLRNYLATLTAESCYYYTVSYILTPFCLHLKLAVGLASFPGRRRNGLATSASSNCYFRCLKVGSTNQISERSHMTTVKPNCVMH